MTGMAGTRRPMPTGDMTPIAGEVEVAIPVAELWKCFTQPIHWSRWARCFFWVRNRNLVLGEKLIWVFQPIRPWYPYKLPAVATIVELEDCRRVTWEVTAFPGFFARHTYHMEDRGAGRTRFGSWEQATGWSFRLLRGFWLAHFTFVRDESLAGARHLERVYQATGGLAPAALAA
jgi:hypothetical protein